MDLVRSGSGVDDVIKSTWKFYPFLKFLELNQSSTSAFFRIGWNKLIATWQDGHEAHITITNSKWIRQ